MSSFGQFPRRPRRPPPWTVVAARYDAAAADYARRHGDRRSERRFRVIDRPQMEAARGARRVLELGCGDGRLLTQVHAPVRIGIDVSAEMLRRARGRGLTVVRADAHALPFPDRSFDAVLAGKGVFRYLDYARAFAECARVLAPGGRLAVHQYAARTWTLRGLVARVRGRTSAAGPHDRSDELHLCELDELITPARDAGFVLRTVHLWRSVRFSPYAVPIPTRLPGRLWSHCVLSFDRRRHPDQFDSSSSKIV
ncbi:class I SAM-dependent methyltransferase [Haliangium sp.]|uniref:class I SAM-dependent methyltransferase n=1 Tax=Haliangium sp. TaxID=2663208 RepID=UPI003D0E3814